VRMERRFGWGWRGGSGRDGEEIGWREDVNEDDLCGDGDEVRL